MNFTVVKFILQPFWQETDRKDALKAFTGVFKRQAPLHGLSNFFFLNKDKIWVLWKMAQAQGFASQDKEDGNSRWGLRQTFREGAVISAVGQGPWAHLSVHCMKKSSTTDASEQKNSEPLHVPLCDDMLLSESQYALAHPLQTVLPKKLFTVLRINVNGGINTKISFS